MDRARPSPGGRVIAAIKKPGDSGGSGAGGSGADRPRVRKPLPRNDQWKAPTPDLEGHRKRLREALGNTLSDEFVDVILGKLVEALRPGLSVVLLVAGTYSVWAQNLSDRIAACLSCHGDDGQSYIVGTPSLGAEPALFVMIQLYLFREKQRQVEPMTQAAQRLSDDDLRSLSDLIAKLPPPKPPEEPVDAARIERAWR
jgi:cytochrome c553